MSIFKLFAKNKKQSENPPLYDEVCSNPSESINSDKKIDPFDHKQINKSFLKKIALTPNVSGIFAEIQEEFISMIQKTIGYKNTALLIGFSIDQKVDKLYKISIVSHKEIFGGDKACVFDICVKDEIIKSNFTTLMHSLIKKMKLLNMMVRREGRCDYIGVWFNYSDLLSNKLLTQKYDQVCKSLLTDEYVKSVYDNIVQTAEFGTKKYVLKTCDSKFLCSYIAHNKIFNDIDVESEKDTIIFTW
jgi:hypothetical protein